MHLGLYVFNSNEFLTSFLISADETADVGVDHHTPVSPDYAQHGNEFTGAIKKIVIELK